jgi:hypothetical protein
MRSHSVSFVGALALGLALAMPAFAQQTGEAPNAGAAPATPPPAMTENPAAPPAAPPAPEQQAAPEQQQPAPKRTHAMTHHRHRMTHRATASNEQTEAGNAAVARLNEMSLQAARQGQTFTPPASQGNMGGSSGGQEEMGQ